jgi:hypothetical protein
VNDRSLRKERKEKARMRRAALTSGTVGGGLVILVGLITFIVSGSVVAGFLLLVGVLGLSGAILVGRSTMTAGVLQLIAGVLAVLLYTVSLVSTIAVVAPVVSHHGLGELSALAILVIVLVILGLVAGVLLIIGAVLVFRQRRARPEGRS